MQARTHPPRRALAAALLAVLAVSAAVPPAAAATTIMAFGDSLVAGYGLSAEDAFPAQLEEALRAEGYEVEVVNAGNSGDTAAAGRARLDWALASEPDAAIVVLGANDALRGLEPERTYANLDAILTRLTSEGIATLLCGMKAPRNLGAGYAEDFDAVFPRLAEAHGVLFHPFFLEGVAAEPSLNQSDGLHPNAEGVAVIVETILPKVEALIARARAGEAAGSGAAAGE